MGTKGWIIFAVVAALVLGGLVYFSQQQRIDVSAYDLDTAIAANEDNGNIGDQVFGNKDSKVVLIEYGDYQCPGCASVYPRVKELTEKYQGQIAFIFRNLPLPSLHPNARAAAATAEAAGLQGKFWEMHDKLYSSQDDWKNASASDRNKVFRGYAEQLGLDLAKYDDALTNEAINKKINFDLAIAREKKFTATPSFVINGEELSEETWNDPAKFEAAITDKLKTAGIALPETPVTE